MAGMAAVRKSDETVEQTLPRRWPCWLSGHEWKLEHYGLSLHVGTRFERRCNIVVCRLCRKAKVSYGGHPPRRNPSPPRASA